jgi:hypothetical protein
VTDDDRRAAYLAEGDGGGLSAADVAAMDELREYLRDDAIWIEPPAELGERITASIATERAGTGAKVIPLAGRRSLRRSLAIVGVAAAAVVAIILVIALSSSDKGSNSRLQFADSLTATPLAPQASGHVTLTKKSGGWRVRLDVGGLPRRDPPRYYEAWLKNAAGVLVPIGTFNAGPHVTLWSAVSPADFPTITITRQVVGRGENSSGLVVLSGQPTQVR